MPRRFDRRGWNRQFKWQPIRTDRWDPFPKDRLPFVDDFSIENQKLSNRLPPRRNFTPSTPQQQRFQGAELVSPFVDTPWNNRIYRPDWNSRWNNRIGNNTIYP